MGQKVNPIAFRLAVNKDWRSKWYASGNEFGDKLHEDLAIRSYLKKKLTNSGLARVVIERAWASVRVTLHTSRPGLIIGRQGKEIEVMTKELVKLCKDSQVKVDIVEIHKPELDAQLVAEQVAIQLERRISFRRAMKRAIQTAMDFGADGIRLRVAGRLGGADIARAESYREGKVPLQTLRVPRLRFCRGKNRLWNHRNQMLGQQKGERSQLSTPGRRPRSGTTWWRWPPSACSPQLIDPPTALQLNTTNLGGYNHAFDAQTNQVPQVTPRKPCRKRTARHHRCFR